MASFLDKIRIKTAVDSNVKLDLSCNHISTANFMQFNVAYKKELVPGEKIKINMETFTRLAPMPVPTFGRANINNRAFFVPFRTVWDGWNDFITDTVHVTGVASQSGDAIGGVGISSKVPTFRNVSFVRAFLGNEEYAEVLSSGLGEEPSVYDISGVVWHDTYTDQRYYKLTAKGRQVLKLIESLGYKFLWAMGESLEDDNQYLGNDYEWNPEFSALPLLCAAKVYIDWYYPSAYTVAEEALDIEAIINRPGNGKVLTYDDITKIINFIPVVNYDSDYFVSAWDNPTNPTAGAFSAVRIPDVSSGDYRSVTVGSFSGTPTSLGTNEAPVATSYIGTQTSNTSSLSQYVVDSLKALTDYMKRHQLVGARALDRYLSRFGVNLPAEKLKRSVYLGSQTQPLQFGDVMSTADTDGANLGNYAGKGISYGDGNFEFETDEYGILVIISSIVPVTGYYQGIDRNNLHVTRLDYWTPEFDNLGTQAISKAELYSPLHAAEFRGVGNLYEGIFGWTPRYAEYKIGRDMLTGDFRYDTINAGADSWHLMRTFETNDADDLVHNSNFIKGLDAGQYSRIFYNTDADAADKFNVIYNFNIVSYSPMKSMFDTYEFDSKGKMVTEDVNGVKMN